MPHFYKCMPHFCEVGHIFVFTVYGIRWGVGLPC
ncbi:hypothetical protein VP501E541_P0157 [Vibrio phage 501E54-1]|nr:hypothetical protein VP501E541_P0157 [Vibrio phage 501E54-1]